MDRFGRRTYHYQPKRSSRHSQAHFFSDDVRNSLFTDADVHGLDDFLEEDMTPFMTPQISNRIKRQSIINPSIILRARPSFQCFASINNDNFNGLDYEDVPSFSVDSMDITSPNHVNGLQISKEFSLKNLRLSTNRNGWSNNLEAIKESHLETPPLPTIWSGDVMEFDIDNDRMQLDVLDIVEEEQILLTALSEITPNSMTNISDTSQGSLGSDRANKVLHKKNDGSLLNMLSFKFLTKHINPMCQ